ncbi:MAG TPA: potassium transporter Kup [Verrucomicrobiota bacterium]|nr:potassium transporter Kup [Verrucomicrobiales bacterium]HRI12188.1 potassium transporter Kup [Verrucomicrobiota bacterium]
MEKESLSRVRFAGLTLAALGVVYGDIGTSPLYAMRECFHASHGVPVTPANVLGVLSLIIWSLIMIVSIKYVVFVLRMGNRGEGGILALLSLAFPERREKQRAGKIPVVMTLLGLFGAALLYGDGMITPAITVLGAVEGLEVVTKQLSWFVVPISVVILIALFGVQSAGTGAIGRVFGPIMVVWFAMIAVLGVRGILLNPSVFKAVNPFYGLEFFYVHGWQAFVVLGSVFLVVTGGEALYADMGHFGLRPIRFAWFGVVLPALLLNYFGQGALLIGQPEAAENPFFRLAPRPLLFPLVGLAAAAAVIASQALISGAYSLTMQAVQLGYLPRMAIEHTSERERGQIFIPQVNWALMVACLALVLGFRSSSNLAGAYGIAVTLTMLITTLLFHFAARKVWGWSFWRATAVSGVAFGVELAFFGANALKIPHGGWFTLVVGVVLFTLMTTWRTGRRLLWQRIKASALPTPQFLESIRRRELPRVKGTGVYLAGNPDGVPIALLHNLKHNKILHERVVFLTILVAEEPRVDEASRITVEELENGFWRVKAMYGFMEEPNAPDVLRRCADFGLKFREAETSFFLSRETIIPSRRSGMARWRENLFAVMARNSQSATMFFQLPANRVVELGMQVEI